jgi:hypothetical protein
MTPTDQQPVPVRPVAPAPRTPAPPAPRQYGLFVPQLLMTLTLTGWLGFQAFQQVGERQQLKALDASGAAQEQAAQKVRASLEAIATATAKLAGDGNANAQSVVDQLRKRGVTINPSAGAKSP